MVGPTDFRAAILAKVFEAVLRAAGDPEVEVPKWLHEHTPLGIKCPIVPSGIFPEVEEKGVGPAISDLMDLVAGWHTQQQIAKAADADGNYSSYVENQDDAEAELQKEFDNGYFAWYPDATEAEHVHGKITLSKVGAVVTTKNEKKKVRLIHDLRRSLVNSEVVIKERLVLPRLSDVIEDTTDMLLKAKSGEDVELVVLDFADAFKHLRVSPLEQPYLAGRAWSGVFVYLVVLFGIGSGPLVWGRVAAAVLRMTQSLLADYGRSECFVDDTLLVLRGCASTRRRTLFMVLLFWQVLGLKLAWRKLERGRIVRWIGAQIELWPEMMIIIITVPADKLLQLRDTCKEFLTGKGMVEDKSVRTFAGRGSWLGGLLPQVRPFFKQVWGALAAARTSSKKNLIYVKQFRPAAEWLLSLAEDNPGGLSRRVYAEDRGRWGPTIVCDASPWGGGALFWHTRKEYESNADAAHFIQLRWSQGHEKLVNGTVGKPDFQAAWEALMLVLAIRTWTSKDTRGKITIIGDASGVIGDIVAMRAKSPVINNFIKEAALHLAPLGLELFGIHIWSEKNDKADELSRVAEDGVLPTWLTASQTARSSPTTPDPQMWRQCNARVAE